MSATSDRAERLVLLHGFTQTHHHWTACAERLAGHLTADDGRRPTLIAPDLPGHGLSHADRTAIDASARELAARTGPAPYVGYSMGGRVALHAALADDRAVERLVLIGATAGIDDALERDERRRSDDALATRIERIGVSAFLADWMSLPLFATLPDDRVGLDRRRRNTASGLAHSLRTAGAGAQRSLWESLDELHVPVLLIAGELDTKFSSIALALTARLPNAHVELIGGAGHAAHSERPDDVAEAIATWVRRTEPAGSTHREADGQPDTEDELDPSGGGEHRHQR
jgi:2-succinyl-6-hydroxy-2,4-cyclohexadiene-1-carboxylate synthase